MRTFTRPAALLAVCVLGASALSPAEALAAATAPAQCRIAAQSIMVPGAAQQDTPTCLPDLTTPGLIAAGRTDASDWATLTSVRTAPQPATAGLQVDGYFPDDSTTNGEYGKKHDAQFVMRFPDVWNGKLLVTGAPGVRKQFALDRAISDWAVAHGYAFASTDKGNTGNAFFRNGARSGPGDAVLEWHDRVRELTLAAKQTAVQVYGTAPQRTYMTGISNGGYLTRWALEHNPELYDGGVDWEGTLFTPDVNLLTFLPPTLKNYPTYAAMVAPGAQAAHDAIIAAGFAPGSESLWREHYTIYWDLTQRVFREEFDPTYDGSTEAGTPFCQAGQGISGCDADYNYAKRPQAVRDAIAKVSLTGNIGKPMLTLHGTLDTLLPISQDSDIYQPMIANAGRSASHRYYRIEAGNHVDSFADTNSAVRPILPCYYDALLALDAWVVQGQAPPVDGTVPRPTSGDEANSCALPPRPAATTSPPATTTPPATTAAATTTPPVVSGNGAGGNGVGDGLGGVPRPGDGGVGTVTAPLGTPVALARTGAPITDTVVLGLLTLLLGTVMLLVARNTPGDGHPRRGTTTAAPRSPRR